MMGNYHARCGAGEKPEVETPEAYLSLFKQIPQFEKIISVIRSRGISASIILQTKSQLKSLYKDNAETIEGNCDSLLFLGGKRKPRSRIYPNLSVRKRFICSILPEVEVRRKATE